MVKEKTSEGDVIKTTRTVTSSDDGGTVVTTTVVKSSTVVAATDGAEDAAVSAVTSVEEVEVSQDKLRIFGAPKEEEEEGKALERDIAEAVAKMPRSPDFDS